MPLVTIEVDDKDLAYFDACARIRNVHPRSLFRRLVRVVAQDQMVGSILDDAEHLRQREKGEHSYRYK